jgi:hypothetical protein
MSINNVKKIVIKRNCSHGEGTFHDCEYVDIRNSLIPHALKIADTSYNKGSDSMMWDRLFMSTMQKLVEEGLAREK